MFSRGGGEVDTLEVFADDKRAEAMVGWKYLQPDISRRAKKALAAVGKWPFRTAEGPENEVTALGKLT